MKILVEKQEATEHFIEEQKDAAISEAQARLSELQERRQKLRESQDQIAALHGLPDTELIRVRTPSHLCLRFMLRSHFHQRYVRFVPPAYGVRDLMIRI